MKTKFKPNTILTIAADVNDKKVYTIDITTRKIYVHSQNFVMSEEKGILIALVLSILIIPAIPNQLIINEASQGFKNLLIWIGILIGLFMFWLRVILEKKHVLYLDDYLNKHPESEEVDDINKVIGKASVGGIGDLVIILGTAVYSVTNFSRFLENSSLGAYLLAVVSLAVFSFSIAGIRITIFLLGLKGQ